MNPHKHHLRTVISGSYRKHLKEMLGLKDWLEQNHIEVLSPAGSLAVNPDEEFVILESDPFEDRRVLQDNVFAKIRTSTFLVIANFEGYIGRAATLEIGYAIAHGLQVYSVEPVEDPNLEPYCLLLSSFLNHPQFTQEALANETVGSSH